MQFSPAVAVQKLAPHEAFLAVSVTSRDLPPTAELRGRLMGPMCRYSTTVEVAYPLKPLPPGPEPRTATARVVIPEPSWWHPVSPFLYRGPVELWTDGKKVTEATVSLGLTHPQLSDAGLRWNGKPLSLRGTAPAFPTEDGLLALREDGINLLDVPVEEQTAGVWEYADRVGHLVLGKLPADADEAVRLVKDLRQHPSALGWYFEPGADLRELLPLLIRAIPAGRQFVGVAVEAADATVPDGVQFVVAPPDVAGGYDLPAFVFGDELPDDALNAVGTLG